MRLVALLVVYTTIALCQPEGGGGNPWKRANGVISPRVAGDSVSIGNTLSALNVSLNDNRVILFGDSITDNNGGGPTHPLSPYTQGYFDWANALLGQPWTLVKNAGVGGNTTSQMLARLSTDVLAYNASWVFVMGGTNDIAMDVPSATIIANLKSIYDQIQQKNGARIVALTVTGRSAFTTAGRKQSWSEVNRWISEYGRTRPNFYVVDTAAVSVDPTSSTGPTLIANWSNDGVHPNARGGYLMGKAIADALAGVSPLPMHLVAWQADTTNKLGTAGFLLGTSGTVASGITGQVPTGWGSQVSVSDCAMSLESRSDGYGQALTIAMSNSQSASAYCTITRGITGFAGEKWVLDVEVLSATNPNFTASIWCNIDNVSYSALERSGVTYPTDIGRFVARSLPFTITTGNACTLSVGATNVNNTIKLGRISLRPALVE